MATTDNINLAKIASTDKERDYPAVQNSNMDAIDTAIGNMGTTLDNLSAKVDQLTPEGALTLLDAYPVGSIYMSVNSTSPATLFGGKWEEIAGGRVLMGQNSTFAAGTTGGSVMHTHTGPAHTHTMAHTHAGPAHTHVYGARFGSYYGNINTSDTGGGAFELWNGSTSAWVTSKYGNSSTAAGTSKVNTGMAASSASKTISRPNLTTYTSSSGTGNTGAASVSTTSSSGTGYTGAASSLMPYLSVYMWKRTA